jgi:hypothetical protein
MIRAGSPTGVNTSHSNAGSPVPDHKGVRQEQTIIEGKQYLFKRLLKEAKNEKKNLLETGSPLNDKRIKQLDREIDEFTAKVYQYTQQLEFKPKADECTKRLEFTAEVGGYKKKLIT